jgi:hypothetical protein
LLPLGVVKNESTEKCGKPAAKTQSWKNEVKSIPEHWLR